jgi:hypothetical protein
MINKTFLVFVFLSLVPVVFAAPAPTTVVPSGNSEVGHISRVGSEIIALKNSGSLGILFGWRYASFESDNFAVGGAGYTGQFGGANTGVFSYGGLITSHVSRISQRVDFETSLLAGGGGGYAGATTGAGIVLEPSIALGLAFGPKVKTILRTGYLWMPSASTIGGLTVGVRFDFVMN